MTNPSLTDDLVLGVTYSEIYSSPQDMIQRKVILVLIIVFCLILIIICVPVIYCLVQRSMGSRRVAGETTLANQGILRRKFLPLNILDELMPIQEYQTVSQNYPQLAKQEVECIICLINFKEESSESPLPVRLTTCYHLFHPKCREAWLE